MPSITELKQMYVNRAAIGGFATGVGPCQYQGPSDVPYYWSSTEDSAGFAWRQDFCHGYQSVFNNYLTYYVRPVRAF